MAIEGDPVEVDKYPGSMSEGEDGSQAVGQGIGRLHPLGQIEKAPEGIDPTSKEYEGVSSPDGSSQSMNLEDTVINLL